jgi:hypothetical protein
MVAASVGETISGPEGMSIDFATLMIINWLFRGSGISERITTLIKVANAALTAYAGWKR